MRARITELYQLIDQRLTHWMGDNGLRLLRLSLGIIYFWFGFLKFFPGTSSAEGIAVRTIEVLTFGYLAPRVSVVLLAIWECTIGMGLLIGVGMRITLFLLFTQMVGTITPLFFFPAQTFLYAPWVPTLEGQYIIKNLILISAGIVLGATVRGGRLIVEPSREVALGHEQSIM